MFGKYRVLLIPLTLA